MKPHRLFKLVAIAALASLFVVCSSVPDKIEEGLTPMEYFQRAQEASDANRYALSMAYYEKFQEQYPEEQYPEERDRNLWAEYEIAFLYHKMGKNQIALERFEALLERYESGEPDLPEGPKILAEKVKARIEETLASEQAKDKTSGQ
jgi:outer membrane protein assembly factor BamD (BamD/ComL family)